MMIIWVVLTAVRTPRHLQELVLITFLHQIERLRRVIRNTLAALACGKAILWHGCWYAAINHATVPI